MLETEKREDEMRDYFVTAPAEISISEKQTTPSSSADKIMEQADVLARYSAMHDGLLRAYLTAEHRQANEQLARWMQQAGLETWQDSVGNLWGRKVASMPRYPAVIIGSHSDTVTNAGKYDGNLGILLGIEAMLRLKEVDLPFHVDIVAFADEEGARFNTTLIGSSSVAGMFDHDWLQVEDANQISMEQAMINFGIDPLLAGGDARHSEDVMAYLEVHIEQGPVLEARDRAVGVVSGIAGAKRFKFTISGMAGHAGTVPIAMRKDAMCGAAQMINEIEVFADLHDIVATVGLCEVISGAINVIPATVSFTLDIRSHDQAQLEDCCDQLLLKLGLIAEERTLSLVSELLYQAEAVPCNQRLQSQWCQVVTDVTEQAPVVLPSGAGHDAMKMASITDIGMLFVRCDKGISHHPAENVHVDDVSVALECLEKMIIQMADKPTSDPL